MRLAVLLCLLLSALPALAADTTRPLDLGPAQLGMRANQLRFSALPANTRMVCGWDPEKPPGVEKTPLMMVGAMVSAKVDRCALFQDDGKNNWSPRPAQVGGIPTELWFLTIEDEAGSQRIFQIVGRQPPNAFNATAAFLAERWGPPVQKAPYFVRWLNGTNEGQMKEDGEGVMLWLFDTKLHALMESRMPRGKAKK
ncbi:hypothetical protein H261_08778 [Paramagnetospirillum caucaseum]|uniref:Uncharacterized protein n=1 Tax=Paramagnetospirillum caucaseum TaxID=1244869 RepID=M3AD14_9PROT|nr:hypothetical protein [Paramagnetospirillum caucaseum]EME70404.1 hypothetical protein H261_08778 [Paramagnetospirillum caucaseum]